MVETAAPNMSKAEAPFVAVPSTPPVQQAKFLDMVLEPTEQYNSEQSLSATVQVPEARFTPLLLSSWLISVLGAFMFGLNIGVTGAIKENAVFPGHSSFQWSVCVAIFSIGGLVGSLAAGPVGSIWARKQGVLVSTAIFIVGGLLMMCAANMFMLTLGRFISGIGAGATGVFVPLYIRELSTPGIRGTLGSGYQVAVTLGLFMADVLAFGFSDTYHSVARPGWRLLVGFSAFVGIFQVLLLPLLPESPCWLMAMNRREDAAEVLMRLRGCQDVSIELQTIQDGLEQDQQEQQDNVTLMGVLRDRSIRRSIVVCCVLQIAQQFSGVNGVMFYANQFFEDAGLDDPLVGTAVLGFINFLSTIGALMLMDRAGRRPLLLWSCVGQLVAQFVLTLALLSLLPASTTIAVVSVITFVVFFEFGFGPIPWLIVAEMLPPAPRATGMSLALTIQWFFTFVIGLIFPRMQSGLGDYTFLPFMLCLALSLWFTLQFVPETKGLSVEQIQRDLQHRKRGRHCHPSSSSQSQL